MLYILGVILRFTDTGLFVYTSTIFGILEAIYTILKFTEGIWKQYSDVTIYQLSM